MLAHKQIDKLFLPETQALLTEGDDARIRLHAGRNAYGCKPFPDPGLAQFGSSTASTISWSAFQAADALRERLMDTPDAVTLSLEFARIRREFAELCGISRIEGLQVFFCASGTDAHRMAAARVAPAVTLTVEASETGRGVPFALSGRYSTAKSFESRAHLEMVAGGRPTVHPIHIRNADGAPRDVHEIDDEVARRVDACVRRGGKVLLVLVDVSKTGIIAPSLSCACGMKTRFPGAVAVLVDACQFRITPNTLRAYLEKGFLVALTGSKFLTGPAFSGALLIPGGIGRPPFSQDHFPSPEGSANQAPGSFYNLGLLLRWEAALAELRAFSGIREDRVARFLERFAAAIRHRLETDPNFEPMSVPPLHRPNGGWDHVQTIFPFLLRKNGKVIGRKDVGHIHTLLGEDLSHVSSDAAASLRCSLGQPVSCGERGSALRLCSSARLAVDAGENGDALIRRALCALDKVALLLDLRIGTEIE